MLNCLIELPTHKAKIQPAAIESISTRLTEMPDQTVSEKKHEIPSIKVMSATRLEYILSQIPKSNLPYQGAVLTGSGTQTPFTTLHDYEVRYVEFDKLGELTIPKGRYLKAKLKGSITELAEAIEYLYFAYLPNLTSTLYLVMNGCATSKKLGLSKKQGIFMKQKSSNGV